MVKKRISIQTEKLLKYKKKVTGLKEEEIIEVAVAEVPIENLLFISRIRNRHDKE